MSQQLPRPDDRELDLAADLCREAELPTREEESELAAFCAAMEHIYDMVGAP